MRGMGERERGEKERSRNHESENEKQNETERAYSTAIRSRATDVGARLQGRQDDVPRKRFGSRGCLGQFMCQEKVQGTKVGYTALQIT